MADPKPKAAVIFKDLAGLVASMKGDLFARWMRRAQKQALIEWRDRKQAPGLAARFEKSGEQFYEFSKRPRPRRTPYYVKTGKLRDMMSQRKPKAKNNRGTDVVTALKFGGGALNFLGSKYGIYSITKSTTRVQVTVTGHQRKTSTVTQFDRPGGVKVKSYTRAGGPIKAYSFSRAQTVIGSSPVSKSYAAEFGAFHRDQPWITKRVEVLFSQISRKASIDRRSGGIKSSVLEGVENGS
jgi:hypothetical protein